MPRSLALLIIGLFFGGGIGFFLAAANNVALDGHHHPPGAGKAEPGRRAGPLKSGGTVMRIATLFLLSIAVLSGAPAAADSVRVGDIAVENAWVRASSVNVSAAYATLHNLGKEPDLLVAAASPAAGRVEIHTIVERDGRVGMKRVDSVEVAPGEPALLQPGGLHIMLMGLKRKLAPGDSIELALRFSKAGRIVIRAPVARSGAPRQPKRTH